MADCCRMQSTHHLLRTPKTTAAAGVVGASQATALINRQKPLTPTITVTRFNHSNPKHHNTTIRSASRCCTLLPRSGFAIPTLRGSAFSLGFGTCHPRRYSVSALHSNSHSTRRALAVAAMADTAVIESAPAWEGLLEKLAEAEFGPIDRVAHAKDRVFSADQQQQKKVVLYRDNSAWCPYCERVWLQLEEKKVNYSVEKVNMRCYGEKPAWYTRMVPSGLLPAVMLDGELLTESLDIMFILEKTFPDVNPLLPKRGTPEFDALEGLLNLERKLFGAWLTRLTRSWGDMGAFEKTMDNVNVALQKFNGPYFLGSQFSMVDAVYAPFLERIAASMAYWPGMQVRGSARWPAINNWYAAMDSRPSYQAIKSDDFGITHNLQPQIGLCKSAEAGASYRALIDGKDGGWDLPLKPEVTAWGTDDGTGSGGAKEEAARSLIENHANIVGFALRGVNGGEKYRAVVDLGLRYVAGALLFGTGSQQTPKDLPKEVALAAAYLRDRVGVPRDLTYPAARQLRAHLHWLVKQTGFNV